MFTFRTEKEDFDNELAWSDRGAGDQWGLICDKSIDQQGITGDQPWGLDSGELFDFGHQELSRFFVDSSALGILKLVFFSSTSRPGKSALGDRLLVTAPSTASAATSVTRLCMKLGAPDMAASNGSEMPKISACGSGKA